jgi:hypothetical protein
MSQFDRNGLISQSNFLFPDNTQQEITPSDIRQFDLDIIDSFALTGSLVVSASYAISSSQAENANTAISASHAEFADQATQAEDLYVTVKNTSGGIINKGLAVHATGVTGENINVILADSSVPADMPAIGLLEETLGINATGRAIINGRLLNVNTSGLVAGQSVYVNGAGLLTTNKPTGSDLIQAIGVAGKINASDGEIIVQGAGRTNDLPNIQDGYAWVGNVDHVPTAVSTASWDAHSNLSELNAFTASQELINSGYNTFTSSADTRLNQLEADTGSQDGRLDNLELFTSSQELINTGYNTFTSSADGRLNNIESTTASLDNSVTNLNSFTSSQETINGQFTTAINSLSGETGSYATTGSNSFIGNQEITGSTGVPLTLTAVPSVGSAVGMELYDNVGNFARFNTQILEFINSGSTKASTRIVEEGILTSDLAQANGNTNIILSSQPYNMFTFGYNDYTGSVRGLFHQMDATLFTAPTDVIIGVDANLGGGWNGEMQIGNQYINKIRVSGSLTSFENQVDINDTLVVSQSAGVTGSIMHFPSTGGAGLQGTKADRFYNVGPNIFETSFVGVDKYEISTQGPSGEIQINAATSMVFNPGTSGAGNFVSTKILTKQDSALSGTGQKDSITIGSYTGANGTVYSTNIWGLQNYPSSGINNAFIIGKYDSSFQKVSELMVNEGQVQMQIGTGADTDYDKILLNDNGNGTSTIQLKADSIQSTLPVHATFPAPSAGNTNLMATVGSVSTNGVSYPITNIQFADYSNFSGTLYEDYFGVEMFGTGYAYGTEFTVNGQGIQLSQIPTGSAGAGAASFVKVVDNYNGTGNVEIGAPTGRVNIATVMKLGPQGSLPGGSSLGDLTVSGSNLYFHDGSNWREVSLV